ncbi:MAG: hypothetical protein SGBAC_013232, partial [Bacillariaceae sp.]
IDIIFGEEVPEETTWPFDVTWHYWGKLEEDDAADAALGPVVLPDDGDLDMNFGSDIDDDSVLLDLQREDGDDGAIDF